MSLIRRRGRYRSATVTLALVAGTITVLAGPAPALANAAEWLDPTFGTSGSTRLVGEGYGHAISNADAQDRVYITTTEFNAGPTRLRRLLANGTVDPAFAGGAGVLLPLPRANYPVRKIIADAGGTVTIFSASGLSLSGPELGVRIDRYTGNGVPDSSFGTNGTLILPPVDPSTPIWFRDAVPRPGGGYFVVFSNEDDPNDSIVRERHYLSVVTAAGALDTTWAPGGPTPGYLEVPGGFEPSSMAVDGSNLVLVGSDPVQGGYQTGVIMRLTGAGKVDPTFGEGGKAVGPGGSYLVLVTATAYYGVGFDGVIKLFRNGTIDFSFGTDGLARGFSLNPNERAGSLRAHLTASHIVVTGEGGHAMGDLVPLVQRFTYDGKRDTSLGDNGLLAIPDLAAGSWHLGFSTTVQSDGRIVGVGGVGDAVVIRINTTRTPITPVPGAFVPLSPARILDTRRAEGVSTSTPIPANGTVRLQVSGRGGVPAGHRGAVVLNVTVTQPTDTGFVTVYPTGEARPLASNVNFRPGRTVANLVTVKLGTNGTVTLYNGSSGTVHLVADVAGYYQQGTATAPGTFVPLTPARMLDTRNGTGVPAAGAVPGRGSVVLQVAGRNGVPASGAGAVVLNVTATQAKGSGFVTVYPSGEDLPTVSNLNFRAGRTVANQVSVKLGAGGTVTLYNGSSETVHLIADVAGYYRAGTATARGTFVAITPTRVVDTRSGTGTLEPGPVPAGMAIPLRVRDSGAIPEAWVTAAALNVTATAATDPGVIVLFPVLSKQPTASNLNTSTSSTVANFAIVKNGPDGSIHVLHSSNAHPDATVHIIVDVFGYFHS